jgi:plasmid maintenance system antidote protein VapI
MKQNDKMIRLIDEINAALIKSGITRTELANKACIKQPNISAILNKARRVGLEQLITLAHLAGVDGKIITNIICY